MLRGLSCALGAVAAAVLAVAGPMVPAAWAGPVDDAVAGLRDQAVFVHPQANRQVDVPALQRAIGDAPIKIAVLPKKSPTEDYPVSEIRTWPRLVSEQLPGFTVGTISGRRFYAGSEVLCSGVAGQAASKAIYANESYLDAEENSDLTAMLVDFVTEVRASPPCPEQGGSVSRGDRYADEAGGGDTGGSAAVVDDTATVLPWVLGAAAVVLLGIGAWVLLSRRGALVRAAGDRTEATELVQRLGSELAALPDAPAGAAPDPSAKADAAGKHGEASALLAAATTDVQFAAVRHAAIEGLTACRAARVAAGLDAGPAIPAFQPPETAKRASKATKATTGTKASTGTEAAEPAEPPLPQYAPGAPHFHAGGAGVPAGWYREPFWSLRQAAGEPPRDPFAHTPHHT
jgi:hypothetical protein